MLLPGTGRGTSRRLVEGAPRMTLLYDSHQHSVEITEHLRSRNSHRHEPCLLDVAVAFLVPLGLIAAIMRFAVDLNCQTRRHASKVQGERTLRTLLPEAITAWPLLERPPEKLLRRAHLLPQSARELHRLDRCLEDARAPSTTPLRAAVPLPVPGRNITAGPLKLLPGTGRGNSRSLVEGAHARRRVRPPHILNNPNCACSGMGALRQALNARPSTSRVWAGSIIPSSHSRAVA